MENKNVILLTVISVATLLTAVIGASFAYFSTQVTTSPTSTEGNKVEVITKKLASTITFAASGSKLEWSDAVPGETKEISFTIANGGDLDANYNIVWTDVTSNFNEKLEGFTGDDSEHPEENFKYQLKCTGGTVETGQTKVMPLSDTDANATIASGLTVTAGQTAACTVTIEFVDTNTTQNYNQGRTFNGTVVVTTDEIKQ